MSKTSRAAVLHRLGRVGVPSALVFQADELGRVRGFRNVYAIDIAGPGQPSIVNPSTAEAPAIVPA